MNAPSTRGPLGAAACSPTSRASSSHSARAPARAAPGRNATATNPATKVGQLRSSRVYLSYGNGVNGPGDPVNPASILTDTVTERPTFGVRTWPVWGRALADAVHSWRFFRPVPAAPERWDVTSALARGEAWDVGYRRIGTPTSAPVLHRTAERVLSAEGTGSVRLHALGCATTLSLPGTWRIPRRCA